METVELTAEDMKALGEYAERRNEVSALEDACKASPEDWYCLDDMARDIVIDLCEKVGIEFE